jgi:anionic cell wall polymer biosynthesis LytR-Cps2A-Psr (LCP) family protein
LNFREIIKDLQNKSNSQQAINYARFFKTGRGEYGEGDKFRGISMPDIRTIAKKYATIDFPTISQLLYHRIHEVRMC